MDEKLQSTPGVFVPYTDEEHAGVSPAPAGNLRAYYQPSQRRQSDCKWICYTLIVSLAFFSAGFAVTRYSMSSSHERNLESTPQEMQSPQSETSSINETLALAAEPWYLYGYTDTKCTHGSVIIADGEGSQPCTSVAGMDQFLSVEFVGTQDFPSTGLCLYGGATSERKKAWTS
ncbi:hypothetical protein BJ170DRAFT_644533, partial [Xylariales sp. AK1849]